MATRLLDRCLRLKPITHLEIENLFGHAFAIQRMRGTDTLQTRRPVPGYAAYLMTRNG